MVKLLLLLIAGLLSWATGEVCDDVDHSACELLQKSQPNLCQDEHVANSICRRHCKRCPIQCYECGSPVLDPHNCRTNVTCASGKACSLLELKTTDGRHEYTMGCLAIDVCNGKGLIVPVGRRAVERRNVALNCCFDDLCNDGGVSPPKTAIPLTSTTTVPAACHKKVMFLIQATNGLGSHHLSAIKQFVSSYVSGLDIGQGKNMVGVASYDHDLHTALRLTDPQSTTSVLAAVQSIGLNHRSDNPDIMDVLHSLSNSIEHHHSMKPDVVVIVSDGTDRRHAVSSHHNQVADLQNMGVKVVSVEIGGHLAAVDSNADHVVHLANFDAPSFNKGLSDLAYAVCN